MNKLNFLTTIIQGGANCLEKRVISFLADRRIPVVLFKSRRSSEKCIKKRRNPLCHKDFGVISFSAARYKNKRTALAVLLFLLTPQANSDLLKPARA